MESVNDLYRAALDVAMRKESDLHELGIVQGPRHRRKGKLYGAGPIEQARQVIESIDEALEPKMQIRLYFQPTPHRAWVIRLRLDIGDHTCTVRSWFDDFPHRRGHPPPKVAIPVALILARTAFTALEFKP